MFFDDKYKAVLYDFDGIFVDSEKQFYLACGKVMKKWFDVDMEENDYYHYWTMRGQGMTKELERRAIKISRNDYKKLEAERIGYYEEACREGKVLFIPGMYETVALFREKYKVAIASNTPKPYIDIIFENAGMKPPCPVIGKHPGLRGKPEPDIFVYASGFLDVNPVDCFVIEDTIKGIKSAKEVSMGTALVKNPYWEEDALPVRPDFVFENHKEFIQALN